MSALVTRPDGSRKASSRGRETENPAVQLKNPLPDCGGDESRIGLRVSIRYEDFNLQLVVPLSRSGMERKKSPRCRVELSSLIPGSDLPLSEGYCWFQGKRHSIVLEVSVARSLGHRISRRIYTFRVHGAYQWQRVIRKVVIWTKTGLRGDREGRMNVISSERGTAVQYHLHPRLELNPQEDPCPTNSALAGGEQCDAMRGKSSRGEEGRQKDKIKGPERRDDVRTQFAMPAVVKLPRT
ncbi:hypothetical protein EV421DRAFT_1740345 [Armillaria borealis]|uniref:Uncharacterized protein n=1 Tax=Armillaria borealis TaxID=47425 RepID=A0AA39J375_9AGAR|nr:hypothetical protein EV421DRAFT_1740345 [Armillaria borealis]